MQRQLLRIRLSIAAFEFILKHVKGINMQLSDALSRLRLKLSTIYGDRAIKISSDNQIHPNLSENELKLLNEEIIKFKSKQKLIQNGMFNAKIDLYDSNSNKNNKQVNIIDVFNIKNNILKNIPNEYIRNMKYNFKYNMINILYKSNENNFIPSNMNDNISYSNDSIIDNLKIIINNINKLEHNTRLNFMNLIGDADKVIKYPLVQRQINNINNNIQPIILPVQTRSMKKKQIQQQKQQFIKDNPELDQKPIFIDEETSDIYQRQKLRKKY